MKRLAVACSLGVLGALLSGCALTHDQVVQRAHAKSNAELCMATIQFPQYGDEIAAELAARGHTCDWAMTGAQLQAQAAQNARYQAALQSAAASINAQTAYQVQQPASMASITQPAQAFGPAAAIAYFTGKQQQVQTVTYQYGWSCEYNYAGRTFWRTFVGSCPASVQVQ